MVEYGFRDTNEKEFKEQIWLFADELPSEIDFETLKKLNNYQYSKKQCKVKTGNKVKSIQRLKEDEGEMDSMIKEIKVVSVVKRPTIDSDSFLVTFDLDYYGKKEFIFYSFKNRHFKFIED